MPDSLTGCPVSRRAGDSGRQHKAEDDFVVDDDEDDDDDTEPRTDNTVEPVFFKSFPVTVAEEFM